MLRANFPARRKQRRIEAEQRQAKHDAMKKKAKLYAKQS